MGIKWLASLFLSRSLQTNDCCWILFWSWNVIRIALIVLMQFSCVVSRNSSNSSSKHKCKRLPKGRKNAHDMFPFHSKMYPFMRVNWCVSSSFFLYCSFFLFIVALFLSPSNSMNVKIMYSHPDWFRFISFAKNKPKRNESRCLGSHANIRYSFGGGWSHRQFVLHFGWICSTFIFVIFAVYFTLSTRPMPSSCTH